MNIQPIGPVAPGVSPVQGVAGVAAGAGAPAVEGTGESFAAVLAGGIERVQQLQGTADDLAVQAATGDLRDVHDYTIASTEAALATSLTVAVRDKALAAFNEIMRMPV